jgi:hypothetical protein
MGGFRAVAGEPAVSFSGACESWGPAQTPERRPATETSRAVTNLGNRDRPMRDIQAKTPKPEARSQELENRAKGRAMSGEFRALLVRLRLLTSDS